MGKDSEHMSLAADLARRGIGRVEPNPPVGAVLVRGAAVVGEGWHECFGGPHAERNAIADARRRGADIDGATLYVTLEPCCHTGKTPPCTEAVIAAGIGRVVVGAADPDPRVSGQGIRQLRDAGIAVTCGVGADEIIVFLAPYIKLKALRRPWVICKWAQTADGCLAFPPPRRWVSGEASRRAVHDLRGICDGILAGIETVLADDPLLTCRGDARRRPARIVVDGSLRIPADCRLLETADVSPVIVVTRAGQKHQEAASYIRAAGAELLELPAGAGGVDLAALLDELGRREHTRLLVEGGARVLQSFIGGGLADELRVYVSVEEAGAVEGLPRFDIADVMGQGGFAEVSRSGIEEDTLIVCRAEARG